MYRQSYTSAYKRPTATTEQVWAFHLAKLITETSSAASFYLIEMTSFRNNINKKTYFNFLRLFNQLFNDTSNYLNKNGNERFIDMLSKKFMRMAERSPVQDNNMHIPKTKAEIQLYHNYIRYNKIIQKSPLMDIIKEANIIIDDGSS